LVLLCFSSFYGGLTIPYYLNGLSFPEKCLKCFCLFLSWKQSTW